MPPVIDAEKCTACGQCAEYCAEDVFFGSEVGSVPRVAYPEFCAHCSCCVYTCPAEAIWLRVPLPMQLLYKIPQGKKS
jgi:Pyruvate/2-oxoacid:ferredoxin oxidoreductase delta subunit